MPSTRQPHWPPCIRTATERATSTPRPPPTTCHRPTRRPTTIHSTRPVRTPSTTRPVHRRSSSSRPTAAAASTRRAAWVRTAITSTATPRTWAWANPWFAIWEPRSIVLVQAYSTSRPIRRCRTDSTGWTSRSWKPSRSGEKFVTKIIFIKLFLLWNFKQFSLYIVMKWWTFQALLNSSK